MIQPNWVWAMVEIVVLTVVSMIGVHVFTAIGITAAVFLLLYKGFSLGLPHIGSTVWGWMYDYSLSMLPLFLLMGAWVEIAGLGKDAYDAAMRWLVRLKGGLAMVSIAAVGLFGAVSGSGFAAVATIGGIGLPEMRRYGYSAALRTGAIVSGAMIDNLIPPSMFMVLYGILTNESVGKMFIAGIVPGVVLVILMMVEIYVWVSLRPADAPMLPREVHFTFMEKLKGSVTVIPIAIIFLFLIGGIYLEWFSPTEAAGMGAVSVLIVALVLRRMSWQNFNNGLVNSAKTTSMLLIQVAGAFIFSETIAETRLADIIANWMIAANLSYIPLSYFFIIFMIIIGIPLEGVVMLILFIVPIFYPILQKIGPPMPGIWLGIMSVIVTSLAAVSPPIAATLYLAQMIDGKCSTAEVIKGSLPFYLVTLSLLVLLIHFPWLATWLPDKMLG
ncbi:MAG: TRAP transporter large permease [Chloroflexota bacterium]